jgi:hypothetical protein
MVRDRQCKDTTSSAAPPSDWFSNPGPRKGTQSVATLLTCHPTRGAEEVTVERGS